MIFAELRRLRDATADALYRLEVEQKMLHEQAWELGREEWAFLPCEDDSEP